MEASATNTVISSKYRPLWESNTRYILITGGRGSQKSFAVSTWACDRTSRYKRWKLLYTRYTMQSAEISIIPEFEEKIYKLGESENFDVTKTFIESKKTGSGIIFSGIKTSSGNQTAKLKSITGLNGLIVEEAEEFLDEKAFNTIDDSIRLQGIPNVVVIVMNPQDIEHWIWARWFEKSHRMEMIDGFQVPISTHPDITHIHTTYLDNLENLSADYLAKIERLKQDNPAAYAHRYLGKWLDKKEGVIYEDWEEGEFDTTLPYCYGLDFGFTNPDAMCKVAVDINRMRLYVDEKMYATKQSDSAIKSNVLGIAGGDDMVVADNNEPRIINGIASAGVNIQEVEKYPGCVVDRIRTLSKFKWIVTPSSHNLKFELRNCVWNDKKAEIPVDKHNHLIKGTEYAATRLLQGSDFLAGNY